MGELSCFYSLHSKYVDFASVGKILLSADFLFPAEFWHWMQRYFLGMTTRNFDECRKNCPLMQNQMKSRVEDKPLFYKGWKGKQGQELSGFQVVHRRGFLNSNFQLDKV